jgi:hypothetical protein
VDLDLGNQRGATIVDVALYLVGVAGLAASLTIIWLSMRAVLDIGGYCADGGPYEIAHHCPDGVGLLLTLSIFVGLGCAGLMGWKGATLGAPYDGLVTLAWPALFISLGWNFLQFGLFSPVGDSGIELGFLIPGILFVIMGAAPLVAYLPSGKQSKQKSETPLLDMAAHVEQEHDHKMDTQRSQLLGDMIQEAQNRSSGQAPAQPSSLTTENSDLVGKLERLSALYRAGSLTQAEFEKAKLALIDEADK